MDKSIEAEVQVQKRKKSLWIIVIILVVLLGAMYLLRQTVSSSLKRSQITTAVVEMGGIENTLNASGEILPEFEEVVSSPIQASVQSVQLEAGSSIKAGQSILTLDKSASETAYTKLKFQLESKHNEVRKLKLQLDKSYYDIRSNDKIKELNISSLTADVENAKRLLKAGGGTREDVEKAELKLKVAKLEKQQLENEIKSKQQTMQVEMREAEIATAIQENELAELGRKLKIANVVASRAGVVTYVNKNIGSVVQEGDVLARIADLGSFKVQGSISDNYIDQLYVGLPAIIKINETELRGKVTNIQPTVQNGVVFFDIQLDEKNHKLFRPNLKVEVFLVTTSKDNVMRVANGPFFKGTGSQDVFVVQGTKAVKRTVHTGMSNFDFVELKDQVKPGDVVITSDMSGYKNTDEITLTD